MRRLAVVLGAVAVGAVTLLVRPPDASACSCYAPSSGQPHPAVVVQGRAGEQTQGGDEPGDDSGLGARPSSWSTAWRFAVEGVERGPIAAGDEIEVHLTQGSEAGCGVNVEPLEPGRRYRVGGSFDEPTRRLHLNLCSGALVEPLGEPSPPGGETAPAPTPPPEATTETTTAPLVGVVTTTTTEATDSTLVAVSAGDGSGGLDGRVVGAAAGAAAGAGAGLFALRRRLSGGREADTLRA